MGPNLVSILSHAALCNSREVKDILSNSDFLFASSSKLIIVQCQLGLTDTHKLATSFTKEFKILEGMFAVAG